MAELRVNKQILMKGKMEKKSKRRRLVMHKRKIKATKWSIKRL